MTIRSKIAEIIKEGIGCNMSDEATMEDDVPDKILSLIADEVEKMKLARYSCPKGCDKSEVVADIKNQIYNQALSEVIAMLKGGAT